MKINLLEYNMSKISDWLSEHKILLFGALGVLLITMTMKTQVVILAYGNDYALRMEYTVYGYCIRASASKKAADPAIQNEIYIGNSVESSVLKAVRQLEKLDDEKQVVKLMSTGIPKNNDKLELQLKEHLESFDYDVEILEP